jgi:hypothetical protein
MSTLMLQCKTCGKSLNEVLMILRQLQGTQNHVDLRLLHHTYQSHQKSIIEQNIDYIEIEKKSTI